MKKRILAGILAMLMGLTAVACGQTTSSDAEPADSSAIVEPAGEGAEDGTYTGTSTGFHGDVTVAVTIAEGAITDIQVVEHQETNGVSDQSIANMPTRILDAQSYEVDAITGATYTSNAIKYAVKNALAEAGAEGFDTPYSPAAVDEELTADIVVIGAGLGGLVSAIEAAEAGASVVILEKLGRIGGSTVTAGGIVYATNSPINGEYDNDPDDMVAYYQERANGVADEALLRYAAENSGASIEWLMEQGVEFSDVVGPTGTSPALRAHYTAEGSGAGLTQPLYERINTLNIELRLETPATELLVDADGAISGVVATTENGGTLTINCKAVIVATGGFDTSEEMKALYTPTAVGDGRMSSVGNLGDGIVMAEAIGADTLFRGGVIGMKTVNPSLPLTQGVNLLPWIDSLAVDMNGERFFAENSDYPIAYTKMLETGGDTVYWIFDSAMADLCELAVSQNYAFKADTIEDLAEAMEVDADVFAATFARYNELGEAGEDADFGKATIAPLSEDGPYYAVKVRRATIGSMGGLLVDVDTQVLSTEGAPIPGLYAVGEVANGGFFDVEYPASGTMLSMTTSFARAAGQNAAEYAE